MDSDGITEAVDAVISEVFNHLLLADRLLLMEQEVFQLAGFLACQRKGLSFVTGCPGLCIKRNFSAGKTDILLDKFTAGQASYTGFHLFKMEELSQIVVGACIQTVYFFLNPAPSR